MLWSKLQNQLYNIIDPNSNFQMHCSVFKTKSAWNAGQRNGISKKQEMIPRYWITANKETIWDFPIMFLNEPTVANIDYYKDTDTTIKDWYFHPDNYTWIADTIREYINTPKQELLTKQYEKDHFGLVTVLNKYDRRISKKIREGIVINGGKQK